MGLVIDVVQSRDALWAMADDWNALARACPTATPFQSAAWALPWIETNAIRAPVVLAVRQGPRLVGLSPLFAWGFAPRRTISLVGAGVSDHLDAIAAPGFERATLEATSAWIDERFRRGECDVVCLDELGPRALLRELPTPRSCRREDRAQSVCPVLTIPAGARALEAVVPREQTRHLRRDRRRAEAVGPLRFERVARGGREALEGLFALHAKRWAQRGQTGVLAEPNVRALHLEAAARLEALGTLRIYQLRLGETLAAVLYGFRWHERLYLYLSGIEPELERVSPGVLLIAATIQDAIDEGVTAVDFLRGDEPYKYTWGAVDEGGVSVSLEPCRT